MPLPDRASRSDADLVGDVIAGDSDAFAVLFRRYRDTYTRFAVRVIGSNGDADDVLQGAWMRCYSNLASCRDRSRFAGWMYQIVANECRSFVSRRGKREKRFAFNDEILEQIEGPASPDVALREELQWAMDRLRHDQREAFVLKYVEELSYDQMVDITGVGESALKMRVKRACDRLRELLEGVPDA